MRDPRVRIVTPGRNLGYAAGCNEGARHARGVTIAFVNSDAVVDPTTLRCLHEGASHAGVGIATGSIRLLDEPALLNSAGNDIHYLGLSWSGHFREPAADHSIGVDVAGASGAGMALSRQAWDDLGGFDETLFMYHDDTDLSLRCHLLGRRIVFVPEATVRHHYEFGRNPRKLYLIERNRLIMVLTSYEARTLALIAPALFVVEVATLGLAVKEGWWRAKLSAWAWIFMRPKWLRARRRRVQGQRVRWDRDIAPMFVDQIRPGNYELSPLVGVLNWCLALYWRLIRPLI